MPSLRKRGSENERPQRRPSPKFPAKTSCPRQDCSDAPLSVYLAAMYPWRNRIRAYARQLEREGIVVTASWLRERKNPKTKFGTLTRAFLRRHAVADAADVCRADALVLFTVRADTPTPRGGRHTEFGIALAAGKRLIVCGPRENIFHFYPGVRQFDSFQAVKAYLIRLKKSGRRK